MPLRYARMSLSAPVLSEMGVSRAISTDMRYCSISRSMAVSASPANVPDLDESVAIGRWCGKFKAELPGVKCRRDDEVRSDPKSKRHRIIR
jgi:hypothetical protein